MKKIYNTFETQILKKKQKIILGGDFNAKLAISQPKATKKSRNAEILEKLTQKQSSLQ